MKNQHRIKNIEKRESIKLFQLRLWLTHLKSDGENEGEQDIGRLVPLPGFVDSMEKGKRNGIQPQRTNKMKIKDKILKGLVMILLLLAGTMEAMAQTSTTPTQEVCVGTEPYKVIPGDPANLLQWSIMGGVSGTDYSISSPSTAITDIVWVTPGTYTVTFRETDTSTSTNCNAEQILIVTVNPLPVATIAYTGSPYCAVGTAAVTHTGQAGGTYVSAAGLVIDGTTGEIDLVASTAGTYTVTYDFSNGTCTNTTEASVTINPLPVATITYPASPYCAVGTAAVTHTGQTGGTYGSTAGLVINASTGEIDLVASTAGTYTVTYNFSNGTCSNTTEASVTINPQPVATIAYPASPYCAVGTAAVTHTGQAGGTYGSTAGLVINVSTGEIDLVASTAGTYTVTYDFSNGTCTNTTQASVTINSLPVATITYPASPYCAVGTAAVTQTGQTGGTYASTAGLIVNASTGEIDLVASSVGTYTVTYNFSNGTCSNTTETIVTINPQPVATIAYTGSSYCAVGTATVTQTGQTGGTYVSTPGLIINAPTGDIDLVASTAGTYTVTYNFSNGTCSSTTEASVTINPLPIVTLNGPSPICEATTSNVYTTETGMSNYIWAISAGGSISAGGTATDNTITVTWNTAGPQTVTVTYTNTNGCSDTKILNITVNPTPNTSPIYHN